MKDAQFLAQMISLVRSAVPEYKNASDDFIHQRIQACVRAIDKERQTTTSMANVFAEEEERAMRRGKIDTMLEETQEQLEQRVIKDDWNAVANATMKELGIIFSSAKYNVDTGSWFMTNYVDRVGIFKNWLRIEKNKIS